MPARHEVSLDSAPCQHYDSHTHCTPPPSKPSSPSQTRPNSARPSTYPPTYPTGVPSQSQSQSLLCPSTFQFTATPTILTPCNTHALAHARTQPHPVHPHPGTHTHTRTRACTSTCIHDAIPFYPPTYLPSSDTRPSEAPRRSSAHAAAVGVHGAIRRGDSGQGQGDARTGAWSIGRRPDGQWSGLTHDDVGGIVLLLLLLLGG
jgi:hypothetical protein